MAVASYMDFFGYTIEGTEERGTVNVEYRVKYNATRVTAKVEYEKDGDKVNYKVTDLGRKYRASKAEQERVWEILRVASNYRIMFIADPDNNSAKSFG